MKGKSEMVPGAEVEELETHAAAEAWIDVCKGWNEEEET